MPFIPATQRNAPLRNNSKLVYFSLLLTTRDYPALCRIPISLLLLCRLGCLSLLYSERPRIRLGNDTLHDALFLGVQNLGQGVIESGFVNLEVCCS